MWGELTDIVSEADQSLVSRFSDSEIGFKTAAVVALEGQQRAKRPFIAKLFERQNRAAAHIDIIGLERFDQNLKMIMAQPGERERGPNHQLRVILFQQWAQIWHGFFAPNRSQRIRRRTPYANMIILKCINEGFYRAWVARLPQQIGDELSQLRIIRLAQQANCTFNIGFLMIWISHLT
jgi:hypothetical protein